MCESAYSNTVPISLSSPLSCFSSHSMQFVPLLQCCCYFFLCALCVRVHGCVCVLMFCYEERVLHSIWAIEPLNQLFSFVYWSTLFIYHTYTIFAYKSPIRFCKSACIHKIALFRKKISLAHSAQREIDHRPTKCYKAYSYDCAQMLRYFCCCYLSFTL